MWIHAPILGFRVPVVERLAHLVHLMLGGTSAITRILPASDRRPRTASAANSARRCRPCSANPRAEQRPDRVPEPSTVTICQCESVCIVVIDDGAEDEAGAVRAERELPTCAPWIRSDFCR